MNKSRTTATIIGAILLYALSTAVSFAAFRFLGTGPQGEFTSPLPTAGGALVIDPSAPRNQACPLNGKLFTQVERQASDNLSPLTVMIENHQEARPQSGLSDADIVYEAVAEGAITRFLAVFYCDVVAQDTQLGPVRSARTYYLDWASEYGITPIYVHVGGANLPGPADALGQIQDYGWGGRNGNDINQFSVGYPTFWRDYERLGHTVATEHTMYTTSTKLWEETKNRGFTNINPDGEDWLDHFTSWKFADEAKPEDRGQVNSLSFGFWDDFSDYSVKWEYDRDSNLYRRVNGGQSHIDLNNQQQITAKVVVVEVAHEPGPIDDLKHLLYQTTGKGDGLIFQNGGTAKVTWEKPNRTARTIFKDAKGKEVEFARGQIWIEVLPSGQTVTY